MTLSEIKTKINDAIYANSDEIISIGELVLQNPEKQFEHLLKTFQYSTPRANVCCKIGDYFLSLKNYLLSIYWYNLAISLDIKTQNAGFIEKLYFDYYPYLQLCVAYYGIGDFEKSLKYNTLAHEINPSKITTNNNNLLTKLLLK